MIAYSCFVFQHQVYQNFFLAIILLLIGLISIVFGILAGSGGILEGSVGAFFNPYVAIFIGGGIFVLVLSFMPGMFFWAAIWGKKHYIRSTKKAHEEAMKTLEENEKSMGKENALKEYNDAWRHYDAQAIADDTNARVRNLQTRDTLRILSGQKSNITKPDSLKADFDCTSSINTTPFRCTRKKDLH